MLRCAASCCELRRVACDLPGAAMVVVHDDCRIGCRRGKREREGGDDNYIARIEVYGSRRSDYVSVFV